MSKKKSATTNRQSHRPLMVGSTIQGIISNALIQNQTNIANLSSGLIAVREVVMSSDLKYADIHISIIGNDPLITQQQFDKIAAHTAAFKQILRRKMSQLRYQPEIRFHLWRGQDGISSSYISWNN